MELKSGFLGSLYRVEPPAGLPLLASLRSSDVDRNLSSDKQDRANITLLEHGTALYTGMSVYLTSHSDFVDRQAIAGFATSVRNPVAVF